MGVRKEKVSENLARLPKLRGTLQKISVAKVAIKAASLRKKCPKLCSNRRISFSTR